MKIKLFGRENCVLANKIKLANIISLIIRLKQLLFKKTTSVERVSSLLVEPPHLEVLSEFLVETILY